MALLDEWCFMMIEHIVGCCDGLPIEADIACFGQLLSDLLDCPKETFDYQLIIFNNFHNNIHL